MINTNIATILSKAPEAGYSFSGLYFLVIMGGVILYAISAYRNGKPYTNAIPKSFRNINPAYLKPLTKYFAYYQKLSPANKKIFEKRVQYFIDSKQFISRGSGKITPEMKALIAASAIQLTFGLKDIYLAHFKRILVYPDDYYSTIYRRYHKGEVNPKAKLIVLSWRSFLEGYIDPSDSINLGLHEMAHALHLENKIQNEEYGFLDKKQLREFEKLTKRETSKIKNGKESIFRDYVGGNNYEFFAGCVEVFFENPYLFKKEVPDLYFIFTKLLNQDPTVILS